MVLGAAIGHALSASSMDFKRNKAAS